MDGNGVPQAGTDQRITNRHAETGCPLVAERGQTVLIRFLHSSEVALCSFEERELAPGEIIVAPSRYGRDLARVLGALREPSREMGKVLVAERVATKDDLTQYEKNLGFESQALRTCKQKADAHGLKMKILSTHLLPEENKLLIFFTADGRVDFRELVRDLVASFRMRIELRQIGVRDETRLLGGVGICGRVLCCHSFPDQMCSVSIKMAKEQNLSLGSMKVSGPCGRLMCCLSYEYGYYASERSKFPKHGTVVTGPSISYTVADVNMIARTVMMVGQEGGVVTVSLDRLHYNAAKRAWTADEVEEGEEE